ncbi:MAG: response regulator [Lachnospiraceae bacterium]|nr:response regulator [Lachnospiraceae bacterium]
MLALQFCDFKLYFSAAIANYGFMAFATWQTAAYFTALRIDFDSPLAYFLGRLGGFTVETIVMTVAGFSLCKIMSDHYRKLIEQFKTIAESEAKLKEQMNTISAIANIYMTVYELDATTNTFKEITARSKPVTDLVGNTRINPQEMINMVMTSVTDEEHINEVLRFVNISTLKYRLRYIDTIAIEYMNKQKLWRRGRFIVSNRDEDGQPTHLLWLAEDIDQEKRERDRLIDMSERAIAASEAKSSFLSNMSHEIRTPINAVLGMNEMILRESEDQTILSYAENVKSAGNTLLGLVNDILDFSKIEAGKIEIIPVDYDVCGLVHDLTNIISIRTDAKGLEFKLDIDGSLPKTLHGDEIRIKQVITNILTNAAKYTEKGSVTFKLSCKTTDRFNNKAVIRVSVTDTGIGIKPEDMQKLFAKFERIEEKRNRNIEGTGLGMSITKSFLDMMGSELEVESTYGKGSTFFFDLEQGVVSWEPIGDYEQSYKQRQKTKEKYKESLHAPEANILVVDDNMLNLTVFSLLIKNTEINTDTAESGDECLRKAAEKAYDLIFLDHMMPGKNGTETLHELRAQASGPNLNTPVICLTADAISGAREQYISAGFTDYLTKPIYPEQLEEMLIKMLPKEKVTLV